MKKIVFLLSLSVLLVFMINMVSANHHYYYSPRYDTDSYKETTEFKKVTDSYHRDYYNTQRIKTTVTEKTEISTTQRTPTYYPRYSRYNYYPSSYKYSYSPYSSFRYRQPYYHSNFVDSNYRDYYYKPTYDSYLGHYNWRY